METPKASTFLLTADEKVKFYEAQSDSDKEAARLFAEALFKLERSIIKLETMHSALTAGGHNDAAQILSAAMREVSESELSIVHASQTMGELCQIAFISRRKELGG